jgi:hypothetical protein
MKNLRSNRPSPFNLAVFHGGPGAISEMIPAALELAAKIDHFDPVEVKMSEPQKKAASQGNIYHNVENFRFISLENYRHKPRIERQARGKFNEILRHERHAA